MIIGDTMETLNQYFAYSDDYSNINNIYINLSRQLKIIHEHSMVVPNLTGESVVYDEDFSFTAMEPSDNFEVDKRQNIVSLGKIMLGAYLSLSTGYRDFSGVDDEWFSSNIDSICSSITSDEFESQYYIDVFSNGSNDYYCDYVDRVKQNESLGAQSNVQGFKKVLKTAASSLYQEQVFDEEDDLSIERKSASLNTIFYPLLIGGFLLLTVTALIIIKIVN